MLRNNADAHISNLGYLWFQEVAEPSIQGLYQPTAAEFNKRELLAYISTKQLG